MEESFFKRGTFEAFDKLILMGEWKIYNWIVSFNGLPFVTTCLPFGSESFTPSSHEMPEGCSVGDKVVDGAADEDPVVKLSHLNG